MLNQNVNAPCLDGQGAFALYKNSTSLREDVL